MTGGEAVKATRGIFTVDSSEKMLSSNMKVMRDEEEKEKTI